MGLWCLSWVFHCLDTRRPPAPFYERVEPDMEFCLNFVNSVTLFYKSFVLPCLLGYRDIFDCPKCKKVILEEDEISESAKGKVFAMTLAALGTADALDSWVYQSCLVDAANAIDSHDDDDLEVNFAQESEEMVTSVDVNHVCPVCSMTSIPADGEL